MRWLALPLFVVLGLSFGCDLFFPPPGGDVVVPAPPPGDGVTCGRNFDCGAGQICTGVTGDQLGTCVQVVCAVDDDCGAGSVCVAHLGQCAAESECTPGAGECGAGDVCRVSGDGGRCAPADASPYTACEIHPRTVVLTHGDTRLLAAHGQQDAGFEVGVVPAWSTTSGAMIGPGLTGACAGPAPCTGSVTAELDGASCTADVVVLPPVPEGQLRVVVTEADSGAPVAGARVVLASEALFEGTTNDDGFFERPVVAAPDAVTVIADGYVWQTVVGATGDTVALALDRAAAPDQISGVTGALDLESVPTVGDLRVGIGGLSLSPSLSSRPDWRTVLGQPRLHPFELEGLTDGNNDVLIPDGVSFVVGASEVKPWFAALGAPRRALTWGGGSRVRLSEVGTIIELLEDQTLAFEPGSRFFWAWAPFLGGATHAAPVVVDVPAAPRTGGELPDRSALADVGVLRPSTVPRELLEVALPERPCRDGTSTCGDAERLDAFFAVPLALAPGLGGVPLGIGAARDLDDDGDLDDVGLWLGLEPTPASVRVALTPRHNGLERADERVWVFATRARDLLDTPAPLSGRLTDKESAAAGVTLPALPTAELDRDAATFTVTPSADTDAFRLRLRGEDNRRHDVWLTGGATAVSLAAVLPDDVEARLTYAELEALALDDDAASFTRAGEGAADLLGRLLSYTSVPCGSGSICLAE